jgi:flagellar biosynthetic protein FlhB
VTSEAEDRTQAPSKRRRQQAREQGQAAHSPELTSAAGLLAASASLALWGDRLFFTLVSLVRAPLSDTTPPALGGDPFEVVTTLRNVALALIVPLGTVLAAFFMAAMVTHQSQVRGLWAPALLAPDPTRLWMMHRGQSWASRGGRGVWSIAKAAIILTIAFWVLRSDWVWFQSLGQLDTIALARAAGHGIRHLLLMMAVAIFSLGLIDFAIQLQRFESLLRLSPDQHREDMRAVEGDPALRARRRRLARSIRSDSAEILAGASLILTGPSGLTAVIAGGPPPRPLSIRTIVSGAAGEKLRQLAETSHVPQKSAPAITRQLAQRGSPDSRLDSRLIAEISLVWPS